MSANLVLRPQSIEDKTWCPQLRRAGLPTTEYHTLCSRLTEAECREIIEAGAPFWLFGDPQKDATEATSADLNVPVRSRERAALDLALAELDELTNPTWSITAWRVDRVRKVRDRIATILGEAP